jgi:ribokinase
MPIAPRIAVVGSLNMDLTTFTDVFPRAGETLFGRQFELGFGGKGANQAVAARLCGAEVLMVGKVGRDLFGDATIKNLAAFGIDVSHVHSVDGVSTGVAPIFVEPNGQNRIIVVKGANDLVTPRDVDAAAVDLARAQLIVLQFEIPLETVYHTIGFAKSRGITCIVNPAPALPADIAALSAADYFIPNETEAELITGLPAGTMEEAHACASALLSRNFPRVLITLGARGLLVADATGITAMEPYSVSVIDSSGAGDAFIGSLAAFLGTGMPESEAISRANLYAALSTTGRGTQKSFLRRQVFETEWASRHS